MSHSTLVEVCRVGSHVEPVCLTRVKCDTGETHWCTTSCSLDGAGVIRVHSHWCYALFYTIIKLVLILIISQEISVSYTNFELVKYSDLLHWISWMPVIYFIMPWFFMIYYFFHFQYRSTMFMCQSQWMHWNFKNMASFHCSFSLKKTIVILSFICVLYYCTQPKMKNLNLKFFKIALREYHQNETQIKLFW
jgi:hypothetical protein